MSGQGVEPGWPLHPSLPHFLYTSSLIPFFFFSSSPRATFLIIFLCGQPPKMIPLWSSGIDWLQLIPNIINEPLFCLIRCHEADNAYTHTCKFNHSERLAQSQTAIFRPPIISLLSLGHSPCLSPTLLMMDDEHRCRCNQRRSSAWSWPHTWRNVGAS